MVNIVDVARIKHRLRGEKRGNECCTSKLVGLGDEPRISGLCAVAERQTALSTGERASSHLMRHEES